MLRRKLGSQGLEVSAQGLGCMGMTWAYGGGDERSGRDTIHRALELGVTLLDTAEVYGPYTNERLVGRAVAGRRDQFEIATKFGFSFDPDNPYGPRGLDGSPENIRRVCEGSLERLGTDYIDLFYQHRVDPAVPIEETVGAMAELVEAGKVRYIGLSEASAEVIRRAHATHPLTAVQSEYSLWTRDPEAEVLPTLRELGIGLVAYSPLGRGFLTGQIRSVDDLSEDDWRRTNPRFQEEALRQNIELADRVRALADERGVTPAQLALAWVDAKGNDIVPIPGTKRPERLEENVAAAEIQLSDEDVATLDQALPAGSAIGGRYRDAEMGLITH
ncbi:MAG TPA: aldo/keto reductase [Solirubrobacteraceae bacterium]|nr:aldo/keto reductase [Solirubrobacteraceae bacterium]